MYDSEKKCFQTKNTPTKNTSAYITSCKYIILVCRKYGYRLPFESVGIYRGAWSYDNHKEGG